LQWRPRRNDLLLLNDEWTPRIARHALWDRNSAILAGLNGGDLRLDHTG
jgi:hypothetical protein